MLAALATGVYFIVALAFPLLTVRLPRSATAMSLVRVRYADGQGILRDVLEMVTARGFVVDELATASANGARSLASEAGGTVSKPMVEVTLQVHGRGLVTDLAAGLSGLPTVQAVVADDLHATGE